MGVRFDRVMWDDIFGSMGVFGAGPGNLNLTLLLLECCLLLGSRDIGNKTLNTINKGHMGPTWVWVLGDVLLSYLGMGVLGTAGKPGYGCSTWVWVFWVQLFCLDTAGLPGYGCFAGQGQGVTTHVGAAGGRVRGEFAFLHNLLLLRALLFSLRQDLLLLPLLQRVNERFMPRLVCYLLALCLA